MPRKLPSHLLFHRTHPKVHATPGTDPSILFDLPIPLDAHNRTRGTRITRNTHFRCAIPVRSFPCHSLTDALRDFLNNYNPIPRPDSTPLHALPLYVNHYIYIEYIGYIDLTDHDLIHSRYNGSPTYPGPLFQTTLGELYDALDALCPPAAFRPPRPLRRVPPAV